ncbi:MAG: DUF951 domain-containing protein [Actinobacteria bacterium]|nr:DUF951 domain-containing protein [Actinomycetota bacterium]
MPDDGRGVARRYEFDIRLQSWVIDGGLPVTSQAHTRPVLVDGTILDIRVDDVVRLRKPHPCGSDSWRVVRVGGDIGLVCAGCARRIMLPRSALARRVRYFVHQVPRGLGPTLDAPGNAPGGSPDAVPQ